MNTYKLSNIPLAVFREYLNDEGCTFIGIKEGHEKWWKEGCERPVIFQTHFKTIPEMVIKNNLKVLGRTRADFIEWLKNRKN